MDITKAVDEKGKTIEPEYVFENLIFRSVPMIRCNVTHYKACYSFRTPNPFIFDMRPRSEKALELIRQSEFAY